MVVLFTRSTWLDVQDLQCRSHSLKPAPPSQLQIGGGGMEISEYWIMRVEVGGKKNLIVNGWVRHWGVGEGVDLKMGNPFQSNFGFWCHKRYLTKL